MSILTMEAFSLIKLWRNVVSDAASTAESGPGLSKEGPHDQVDEEESFFELVFTASDCGGFEKVAGTGHNADGASDDLPKSPRDSSSGGRIFPIEANSKPPSPISLLRSAPKFRVFMFGFGRSKTATGNHHSLSPPPPPNRRRRRPTSSRGNRFSVKCEVEEIRIGSLFARDGSLRSKLQTERSDEELDTHNTKRSPKDVVHKYMKLIKPLYVKVSKRYGRKMRFADQVSVATPSSSPGATASRQPEEKHAGRAAGFRVVCKHLGKSRSASSASGIIQSPASRRDDSLVQQHDGIQSAILHCKSSYNSRRDCSLLSRSTSDPWHEKSTNLPRFSVDEQKRSSI